MPCRSWPMSPDEYAESLANEENKEAMFVGTVWIPGETGPIQISAPIPEDLARRIGAVGVAYDLNDKQRKKDQAAKAEKLKELQYVPKEYMKDDGASRFEEFMDQAAKNQQAVADQQRREMEKMNNYPWPQPGPPPSYPTVPMVPPQGNTIAEMFKKQQQDRMKKGKRNY